MKMGKFMCPALATIVVCCVLGVSLGQTVTEAEPASCASNLATCTYYATWTISTDYVDFEVAATAVGIQWVGIGFSDDGSMPGIDAVLGWVNGGTVVIQDVTAGAYNGATIDSSQSAISNKEGSMSGNTMTIKFRRTITGGGSPNLDLSTGVRMVLNLFSTDGRPSAAAENFVSGQKHTGDKKITTATYSFIANATTTTTTAATTVATTEVKGTFTIEGVAAADIDEAKLASTLTSVFGYPTTVAIKNLRRRLLAGVQVTYTATVPASQESTATTFISGELTNGNVLKALKSSDPNTFAEATISTDDSSSSNTTTVGIAAGAAIAAGLVLAILTYIVTQRGTRKTLPYA